MSKIAIIHFKTPGFHQKVKKNAQLSDFVVCKNILSELFILSERVACLNKLRSKTQVNTVLTFEGSIPAGFHWWSPLISTPFNRPNARVYTFQSLHRPLLKASKAPGHVTPQGGSSPTESAPTSQLLSSRTAGGRPAASGELLHVSGRENPNGAV